LRGLLTFLTFLTLRFGEVRADDGVEDGGFESPKSPRRSSSGSPALDVAVGEETDGSTGV
jgi:hypothetical protein